MSEMKAGRELDALVAEKVFGAPPLVTAYKWLDRKAREYPRRVWLERPKGLESKLDCHTHATEDGAKHRGCVYAPQDYVSHLNDAWEVVAEMDRRGFDLVLHWGSDPFAAFIPRNAAYSYDPMENAISATAATVPVAICLAALKAVSGGGPSA